MLKFFDKNNECHIVLNPPITDVDIVTLEKLFDSHYIIWRVIVGHVYSIEKKLVTMLYNEIFIKRKKILITTHKAKLNKYLHHLGFSTTFHSLLKEELVDATDTNVILIGGSAGSSEKIIEIIQKSSLENFSVVIVQHIDPNKDFTFDGILQKYTSHKVEYVQEGTVLKNSTIYLAKSNRHLKIENGRFILSQEEKYNFARPSISLSYESFSRYYKEKLLIIQECGYASDGVDKLDTLKSNGSKVIVQSAEECKAKSMVLGALNTGCYDYIFTLKDIIEYINFIDKNLSKEQWTLYLLEKILERYGYDFKEYQADMVRRRLDVFMLKHELKSIKNSVGLILFNKSAFKAFFLDLSINVTEFFRDPSSYKKLSEVLLNTYKNFRHIKIWSAGCSSGKEAYSIAILLASLKMLEKTIIYATDFNSVILEEGKNALYSLESYKVAKKNFQKSGIHDYIDNYIVKNENYIALSDEIRDKVLFLEHNLVTDSSFNEFDIIICKNVVIYFANDLQERVFQLFYDSLRFGGHLVLGCNESIHKSFEHQFEQIYYDSKIYKKVV